MNKKKKIIILIMIILIIGISGYFLYSRLLNKNIIPIKDNDDTAKDEYKEYSLERYAYTNLNISKNSKMNFRNGKIAENLTKTRSEPGRKGAM